MGINRALCHYPHMSLSTVSRFHDVFKGSIEILSCKKERIRLKRTACKLKSVESFRSSKQ